MPRVRRRGVGWGPCRRADREDPAVRAIPGDCGDECRRAPFATASGDPSHHLAAPSPDFEGEPVPGWAMRVDAGDWTLRTGVRMLIGGTTATRGSGEVVCRGDPAGRATFILGKSAASRSALGGTMADVVRTRFCLAGADDREAVLRAHGRACGDVRPTNTLVEAGRFIGDHRVEIDAEAGLDDRRATVA